MVFKTLANLIFFSHKQNFFGPIFLTNFNFNLILFLTKIKLTIKLKTLLFCLEYLVHETGWLLSPELANVYFYPICRDEGSSKFFGDRPNTI